MRILMLSQCYPPVFGGIERHVQDLGAELVARGHQVAVATLWQHGLPAFASEGGVRVYRLRGTVHRASKQLFSNPERSYAPPIPDPGLVLALRQVTARERPQVVHGHNWLERSFLPLKAQSGARLVVTLHDYGLLCAKWTLMRRDQVCEGPSLARCLACSADHYGIAKGIPTALGNWAMGRVERSAVDMFLPVSSAVAAGHGFPGSRVPYQVVPNFLRAHEGIPGESLEPYVAQLPGEGFLAFVGAFGQHKGFDVLLEAYGSLEGAPPLVLIGYETSEYPLAGLRPPPNVLILRHWPHAAVMEAWRRSLMALVPSVSPDSCPTVVLEAMSAGRPVIASHIGGLPDLVANGETGLLVPPGDPRALRAAIAHLLADPERRQRMGQAARARFADFTASAVVPRIERVYAQLAP